MSPSTSSGSSIRINRIERWCARLFLLLLTVVLALVAAELASYWIWGKQGQLAAWEFPIDTTRVPKPYVVFGGVQRPENHFWMNRLGYPGREPTPDKPLSEYRIFMLGGSTVFHGNPPIAEFFEAAFHERGYDQVRVYNFGCVSQMTGAELARVVHEISDLHPDLILHYSGGNDGWLPHDHDPRPNYPYNFLVHEANPLFDMPGHGRRALWAVAAESNLVRGFLGESLINLVAPRMELKETAGCYTDSWRRRIAEIYVNNLVRSQQMSREIGARGVAVLQPHACYPEIFEQQGIDKVNTNLVVVKHFARVREMILEFAQQAARDDGLELHDMSYLFRDREPVIFSDSVHVQQEAHPILGERLCELLTTMVDARAYKPGGPIPFAERERRRWSVWSTDEASGRIAAGKEAGVMRLEPAGAAGAAADLRVSRRLLPACENCRYVIQFRARAEQPRTVRVAVAPAASYARDESQSVELALTEAWQTARIQFQAPRDHEDLQIELQLGGHAAAVEIADAAWDALDKPEKAASAKCDGGNFSPAVLRATLAREASWYVMGPQDWTADLEFPAERPGTVRLNIQEPHRDSTMQCVLHRRWRELRYPGDRGEAPFLVRCSPAQQVMATVAEWKTPWREGRGQPLTLSPISAGDDWRLERLKFPTPGSRPVSVGFQLPLKPVRWEIDEFRTTDEPAWPIQIELQPAGP